MRLTLRNIGIIESAKIEIDRITAIAGFNGTGKSTVSKALYAIIQAYIGLPKRVTNARNNSVHMLILNYLDKQGLDFFFENQELRSECRVLAHQLTERKKVIPDTFSGFLSFLPEKYRFIDDGEMAAAYEPFRDQIREAVERSDERYMEYLIGETFREIFDRQINTIGEDSEACVELSHNTSSVQVKFAENKVISCTSALGRERLPIYISPKHLLDSFSGGESRRYILVERDTFERNIHADILKKNETSEATLEESEARDSILRFIDSIVHGKLMINGQSVSYLDSDYAAPISLTNLASGNKTIATLRRLLENGTINNSSILIVDEPESNLHPDWQVKLAEILIMLNAKLGTRVAVNTHSPYFVRALEVYSQKWGIAEGCHYYKTDMSTADKRKYITIDVTEDLQKVYSELYMPLEEL